MGSFVNDFFFVDMNHEPDNLNFKKGSFESIEVIHISSHSPQAPTVFNLRKGSHAENHQEAE